MIEILLLLPVISALFMFLFKNRSVNLFFLVVYAAAQLVIIVDAISRTVFTQALLPFLPEFWFTFTSTYFHLDSVNVLFILLTSLLFTASAFASVRFLKDATQGRHTLYSVFMLLFVFSMFGVLLSTNLGLLWVFTEATTLTSAVLIYYHNSKSSLEATWKYIFICSIGIAFAFIGIIFISLANVGHNSLFFAQLYATASNTNTFWLKLAFCFILMGLGTKMGLAPVHAWLPDAHSEAPAPVSALLSGALLNTAFLGIIRVYKLEILAGNGAFAKNLMLLMGFFSLFVSAVYLLRSKNYKRMLAYSSIENMGIIAIGFGLGSGGILASLMQIIAHSLTKSSLFISAGAIYEQTGSREIAKSKGLALSSPLLAGLWIAGFLGISGFPPFISFFSEFEIAKSFFSIGFYLLFALFIFLLTVNIYGMGSSVFTMAFGKNEEPVMSLKPRYPALYYSIPPIVFIILTVMLGIGMPNVIHQLLVQIAREITI